MNYQEARAYLDSLQLHKIKLGLEAMESFLDKVARPDRQLKFIHVAGTNGKGSVSVNITTVLSQAGYRVGLFTSPHLSSVRERFRINNSFISEDKFAEYATFVRNALGEEMITYFEFTTAIALLWFAEERVDLVVLETGLGGRLDATNVVLPLVSIITNVSMDHEAYLGNDLASVAFEKAGIIKEGVPLVTGAANDISLSVIEKKAEDQGAPVYLYGREFSSTDNGAKTWNWQANGCMENISYLNLRCGMKGDYQTSNSSLAVACLQLLRPHGFHFSQDDIRQGLLDVHWPGRLEYLTLNGRSGEVKEDGENGYSENKRYLIDGAHNPAGVASLVETLSNEYSYRNLIVVWGAMEDKDLSLTVPSIGSMASVIVLTKPAGDRAATPQMLFEVIPEEIQDRCHLIENVEEALLFAEKNAQPEDLIVIAGSLYLIGEIRTMLLGELVS